MSKFFNVIRAMKKKKKKNGANSLDVPAIVEEGAMEEGRERGDGADCNHRSEGIRQLN